MTLDLRQLARVTDENHGTPLTPSDLDGAWFIRSVVVLCEACEGAPHPDCECGGTGFDWTDTADVQATLRALARRRKGQP